MYQTLDCSLKMPLAGMRCVHLVRVNSWTRSLLEWVKVLAESIESRQQASSELIFLID